MYHSQENGVRVAMLGFDGHTVLIRLKIELVSCDTMELTFLRVLPKGS